MEGLILFSNNKTASWLSTKSVKEREELFKKARKLAPEFRQQYQKRREKLLEDRSKILRDKQMALQHAHDKLLHDKEKLTKEIMVFGLWQSEDQIRECLASIKSTPEKLRALKLQLDF